MRSNTGQRTDETETVIARLRPHTNYSAVVRARNKQYRGPASNKIEFETPEGIPSVVSSLRVVTVGAHSILVQWEPRNVPTASSAATSTFTNDRNDTEETYVLHRQHHYLHERAAADSPYK
ncbi:unnamed protein product, partial [Mesorhabditis spiculigera]